MLAIPLRRWVKGIAFATLIALAGTLGGISTAGLALETNIGLSWLFGLRGGVPAPDNVAVVAINDGAAASMGLPGSIAEWPRSTHGRLIDSLVEKGASAIVFDVFFRVSKDPADDSVLADAMARARRVVLVQQLTGRTQPVYDTTGALVASYWEEELIPPLDIYRDSARGIAPFPLPKIDAAVYEFWTYKDSASDAPTMPAMAFQVQSLPYYDQWYDLALNAGLPLSGELAPENVLVSGADALSALMKSYRKLFLEHPSAIPAIDTLIEQQYDSPELETIRNTMFSLLALYSGDIHRYINFYGPPGTVTTIAYDQLVKDVPDFPLPDLAGKTVFIGHSDVFDPGQPDRFYTVFTGDDGVDLSGVEIAATVFGNLSTNNSLEPLGLGEEALILFVAGFLCFALIYFFPAAYAVPVVLVLSCLYLYFAYNSFAQDALWMPVAVPVLVQLPAALLLGLMAQYLLERRRGQRISEAIAYYLPENIARDLAHRELDPGTVNNVVFSTCLATDMAGFSTIAEHMSPGQLATFLNEYFEVLAAPLKKYDVNLTEFRADAIMCAWTGDEHAVAIREKPILAALDAVKAIDLFKVHHQNLSAGLRVGLECGSVYIGHAGGGGRFVYSIVGDCANTASRIESLNKHLGTQILATQKLVEGIENRFIIRSLGSFQFVGKGGGMPIVEILGTTKERSEEMDRLLGNFAEALEIFARGDWSEAKQAFTHYLESYPKDGPSKFYVQLCERYLESAYVNSEPGLVKMDQK